MGTPSHTMITETPIPSIFKSMPADPPPQGLYPGTGEAAYRRIRAWNQSILKDLGEWSNDGQAILPASGKSPAHVRAILEGRMVKTSKAKDFGTDYHMLLLEPERFAREYVALNEKLDLRRTEDKELHAELVRNYGADRVLDAQEWARLKDMADAAAANPMAKAIIGAIGEHELMGVFTEPSTGSVCKFRVDKAAKNTKQRPVLVDVKSTRCAHPRMFERDCAKYGYHVQAALYCDGYAAITGEMPTYFILAQESAPPYPAVVYRVPEEAIDAGRVVYRAGLALIEKCVKTNEWPGYADGRIVDLHLPDWAQAEREPVFDTDEGADDDDDWT